MGKREKYTVEQVIAALKKTRAAVYLAADELHCVPKTVYNYAKRYASVRDCIEAEDGKVTDTAELKLASAILNGEPWAILFRLRTKGKSRGYVERQEITGADGGAIEVVLDIGKGQIDPDGLSPWAAGGTP